MLSFNIDGQINSTKTWITKFDYQKSFIENKGQFSIPENFGNPSPVLYAIDHGGTKIYFTRNGITYTFLETSKKQKDTRELEKEKREELKHPEKYIQLEKEEHRLKVKKDHVTMLWRNSNPNVEIERYEETTDYHNYGIRQKDGNFSSLSNIKSFKKIIYKNIYPNIDIEYVFHEKGGLKYSLTIRPGANPSLVKMVYDRHLSLTSDGEIHINTKFGDIIDHAPLSFYQQNTSSIITSKFTKTGEAVSFQLENYDNTKTVIIDPWTQTPAFTSNWDCVWECERDGAGNVYIIGGVSPMQLLKYNSTGTLQWTYNTPYDTTSWLGTMATDLTGNSYVSLGSVARILKVNNSGTFIWANDTIANSGTEFWSMAFNCDQSKLVVGGTIMTSVIKGAIFTIDINTGVILNKQIVGIGSMSSSPPTIQEVRSIAAADNSKYYFLTLDSIGRTSQNFSNCTSGSTITKDKSKYALDYKCENFRYDNSGISSIKANQTFLYTQNGSYLHKRSLYSLAIIDSAFISGGSATISMGRRKVNNSGIDIDACGNVYVGSTNAVIKFDGNSLTQLASYPTNYNVYDVVINSNGDIIACGSTGNSSTSTRSGYVESISTGTCVPMTQTCCDASICSPNNFCNTDLPFTFQSVTAGGTWSGTGITNVNSGIFDPSIAGIGTHTIKYSLPCGSDSIMAKVNACSTISVCVISGSLTASGGNGNYLWSSLTTSISCASCPGGNCIPFVCNGTAVPTWTASGTTIIAPATNVFPIIVKDVVSNTTYTFSSLSSLPVCNNTSITEKNTLNNSVLIYPNPNSGEFNISYSFKQEGQDFILIDMLGKEVKQIKLENRKGIKNIDVSDLSNGIYSYKIVNKKDVITSGKLSINR